MGKYELAGWPRTIATASLALFDPLNWITANQSTATETMISLLAMKGCGYGSESEEYLV